MLIDGITTTATSKVQVASTPSAASDVVTKAFLENTSAVLDGSGKVPASKLPQLVITDTFVVSSQAAMLATGAEQGDIAIRIDQSKTYILAGSDATVLANWTELVAGSGTTAFTGDVTGSGSGSIALTLANSGVTAGTYGSSSLVPVVTVDAKGRITGVTTQSISAPAPTTTASINTWTGTPYDLAFSIFGKPSTAEVVFRFVASRAFTIPANFAGAIAKAQTAATNSAAFEIKKNGASLGSISFGAGGTSGSFASNPATSFASGDVLSITVLTLDSTLADIDFTIPATLN